MKINVKLDEGAMMPLHAHPDDAGYDLLSREHRYIMDGQAAIFDTGVHMEIPKGYAGFIKSKSGLNMKHGLLCEGVVDSGYTGSICVKLYNFSGEQYHVQKRDKIAQIVILPIETPELREVDKLEDTERGNGSFGSTGR